MKIISILKNKLNFLTKIFTHSSKSKIDVKSARHEARKLMQIKPTNLVQEKLHPLQPKIQLIKKISLGQGQTTLIGSTPKISLGQGQTTLIESTSKIITLNPNNISNFKPGYVFDTNILMHFEDYPEFSEKDNKLLNKLSTKPIYILSTSRKEFLNKKCPANKFELIQDTIFTGKKRNFKNILKKLPTLIKTNIYYVNIETCTDVIKKAENFLPDLKYYGLHTADSQFLSFAYLTHSTLITCDKDLINSCIQANCKYIEFLNFAEKILQPSPITEILRDRRDLRKSRNTRGHQSSHKSKNGRNQKTKNRGVWY